MRRLASRPLLWLAAAVLAAAAGVLVLGGGDDGDRSEQRAATTKPSHAPEHEQRPPRGRHRPGAERAAVHKAVASTKAERLDLSERRVARVVRAYVAALNARDGGRACALFVPGGLASVDLPRDRGDCARSLTASIGYRDPHGFPVYDRARVARIGSVTIDGSEASVTATMVTHFAGSREPSIEDDLVYLREQDGRWLIVKPSVALYRAIGVGDIPPQVLAPP